MCHHRGNVSRHVLITPVVLLLSGIFLRLTATNAGHMTDVDRMVHIIMVSHGLKSSDNVIKNQVRDVITYLCLRPPIDVTEILRFADVVPLRH